MAMLWLLLWVQGLGDLTVNTSITYLKTVKNFNINWREFHTTNFNNINFNKITLTNGSITYWHLKWMV